MSKLGLKIEYWVEKGLQNGLTWWSAHCGGGSIISYAITETKPNTVI